MLLRRTALDSKSSGSMFAPERDGGVAGAVCHVLDAATGPMARFRGMVIARLAVGRWGERSSTPWCWEGSHGASAGLPVEAGPGTLLSCSTVRS